ncbi:Aquaglyceroporin, putative [Perkinsus marinus ATCC 50983]|uniref:Aquaglyceroporin, putative n=1 Tax=Perkinsus marinus (strain ATCC 50983 / TXsc) TaxID=423536 RepID=C5KTH4_PERM5|nr:Aquaglyceroporin, putative [Perkinsus marinus ATCC 50983]EER12279.1 Aquaglyceroporin, putative [Perkinsus marinus ATCC 50983]|eukprot:XP_002780484.1 Aquaglyceroporin, putative [Perkinsus marinus ATCC 50983]
MSQSEKSQIDCLHFPDCLPPPTRSSSERKEPPPLWRKCLAEVFGTAVLLAFGSGVVAQVNVCGLGNYLCIAIGWALGVTFGALASFRISGAHLNPAVSLASCVYKQMPWKELLPYVVSQVVGAFIGACITYLCYYQDFEVQDLSNAGVFATYPREGNNAFNSFVNEVVGSALLTAAIAAITDAQDETPANRFIVAGFVGLVVLVIGLSFGVNTGYAINPARDFGPRLFSALAGWGSQVFTADNYYFWVPIVGPLVGGTLGMGIQRLILW